MCILQKDANICVKCSELFSYKRIFFSAFPYKNSSTQYTNIGKKDPLPQKQASKKVKATLLVFFLSLVGEAKDISGHGKIPAVKQKTESDFVFLLGTFCITEKMQSRVVVVVVVVGVLGPMGHSIAFSEEPKKLSIDLCRVLQTTMSTFFLSSY